MLLMFLQYWLLLNISCMNPMSQYLLIWVHNLHLKQIEMLPKNLINGKVNNNILLLPLKFENLQSIKTNCKRNL